jgi:chromate transporter
LISGLRLFGIFLRLGATTYGGPVGGMATFQQEFVERRQLISPERFAEILTLAKLIPGPAATAMGIQIGRDLGGTRGGLAAGAGFILPAFMLAVAITFGLGTLTLESPVTAGFLTGARASAWVLIALSLHPLARVVSWERFTLSLALISTALVFKNPTYEAAIVIAAGLLAVFRGRLSGSPRAFEGASWLGAAALAHTSIGGAPAAAAVATVLKPTLLNIAGVCFKAGAFTFGTGLAVLPVLQGEFVERLRWIPLEDFMNAITIGQITPGPILITATVLGFQKAGLLGAVAATLGAFTPAFIYVLLVVPHIWDRIRNRPATRHFLGGALPAVVGAIAAMTLKLFPAEHFLSGDIRTFLQPSIPAALAVVLLVRYKAPAWLVIPGSGIAGALLRLF